VKWFEIKIQTSHEAVEIVAALLLDLDVGGVVIEDPEDEVYDSSYEGDWDYIDEENFYLKGTVPTVKGYVSHIDDEKVLKKSLHTAMEKIQSSGMDVGSMSIEITQLDDADWANEWKKYYEPFSVGDTLVVVPSWQTYDNVDNRIVLSMDPSGAFGSGTHETTFTCIEAIQKHIKKGDRVFDIGCGSGILSVAAALLGASEVTSVDFSLTACETAKENVRINDVESQVKIIHGNLTDHITGKAQLIVANIIADVIIQLAASIGEYLEVDGLFIASGIIDNKYEEVLAAFEQNNLVLVDEQHKGEWHTLVAEKRKIR
jgi:ribosomal protein L11 methyltransferase